MWGRQPDPKNCFHAAPLRGGGRARHQEPLCPLSSGPSAGAPHPGVPRPDSKCESVTHSPCPPRAAVSRAHSARLWAWSPPPENGVMTGSQPLHPHEDVSVQ